MSMPTIFPKIDEDTDKKLKIWMANENFTSKNEAAAEILKRFFNKVDKE
jgi:hypothetical protein